jgi:hypothetical protein
MKIVICVSFGLRINVKANKPKKKRAMQLIIIFFTHINEIFISIIGSLNKSFSNVSCNLYPYLPTLISPKTFHY